MKKGFTVIEVLIVLSIIFILVSVVVTFFKNSHKTQEIETDIQEAEKISTNWVSGDIYKFSDGLVTCYTTAHGISCIK